MNDVFRVGITRDFLDEEGKLIFEDMGLSLLTDEPHIEVEFFDRFHLEVPPEQIQDYDAVIVLKPRFTPETLQGVERLTVIARFGVGYDNIHVPACTEAGVMLFITPDGVRRPMAESVVTWMLMLSKRALAKDRLMRAGEWDRSGLMGFCLPGRTLGLIGLGNIGAEVVKLLTPFGMRCITFDPYLDEAVAGTLGVEAVSLDDLLRHSDIVSIHCPLNDASVP